MASKDSTDDDRNGEGVAAVDRAIAIVTALEGSSEPVTLSELSRLTGFYKSTVLRLLSSLERCALVTHRADGRYSLGPFCAQLGRAFDSTHHLQEYVVPVLEHLVEQGTESASFHVRYDSKRRLCLFRVISHHPTLDSIHAGDFLPMESGAAARVIRYYKASRGQKSQEEEPQLLFYSVGERDPACAAIACPVFGPSNEFLGAISLSGPKERFTDTAVKRMSNLLVEQGRNLTEELGGVWPARGRKRR